MPQQRSRRRSPLSAAFFPLEALGGGTRHGLYDCSYALAEVLAALGALRVGGALVVKLFTFYEGRTAALLEALAAAFDDARTVSPLMTAYQVYQVPSFAMGSTMTAIHVSMKASQLSTQRAALVDVAPRGP